MRLTEKQEFGYASLETNQISLCSDKLGQLEDIEEKLGIEIITLFNLNKIWFRYNEKEIMRVYVFSVDIKRGFIYAKRNGTVMTISTKDYGKTWALTKEELL